MTISRPILALCSAATLLSLATPSSAEHTIAILGPAKPTELFALQALSEAELSSVQNIAVVERQNLDKILREHKLAISGLADPVTAIRVGKLVGAELLVFIEPAMGSETNQIEAGGCVIYDS